jgi:DNA-binding MltR family transcriptional regulator
MVLSMSSFMEDLLGNIIKDFMLDVTAATDLVEGFNAPLGTFSARTKAAYALGLISKDEHKDINLIRKIRNEFAHSWFVTKLDDQRVCKFTESLSNPWLNPGILELTIYLRFQYRAAEILIALQFRHAQIKVKRLNSQPPFSFDFYPPIQEARAEARPLI